MKRSIYISMVTLAVMVLGSCQSFLEEEIYTSIRYEDFYQSEDDLRSGVLGCYSAFQSNKYYDLQIFHFADMTTDFVVARFSNNVFDAFSTEKSNSQYRTFWEGMWLANNPIAVAITYGWKIDMDEDTKCEILAEAYFLRALNYFNLIRIYGRVPLILEPTTSVDDDLYPATVDPKVVYDQIVSDLKFAKEHLQTNDEAGSNVYATKGAATALLGKVYLTMGGYHKNDDGSLIERGYDKWGVDYYTLAAEELSQVVNGEVGTYALFDDYADVFSNDTENGIENIFSIQFMQGATGGVDGGEGSQKQTNWAPQYDITQSSYETFRVDGTSLFYTTRLKDSDSRKAVSILSSFVDGDGVSRSYPSNLSYVYNRKYLRDMKEGGVGGFTNTSAKDGEENTIVLRYADVLLCYSEALFFNNNEVVTDEVLEGINAVKRRAGISELTPTTSTVVTTAGFIEQLVYERELELCFEGQLWFDYVRLGVLAEMVTTMTRSDYKFYTFPVPTLEINKNPNLLQSQGW